MTTDVSVKTRSIYHKQHMRIAKNDKAMQRFIGMFSTKYFQLEDAYFQGKTALDAGCGDTAKVIIALNKLGAKNIYGFDLGHSFIPVAKNSLKKYGVPLNEVNFQSGNVLNLPYTTNSFDFVVCHGVLVHLNNLNEIQQAFSELSRVTKPGGYLYTVFGVVGGLFEDAIIPALRNYYEGNSKFKRFIDNISPDDFSNIIDFIAKGMKKYSGEDINLCFLKNLFDLDLCVTLQNIMQAPIRLSVSSEYVKSQYLSNGFEKIKRLNRYVKRKNIRKFFAPLHYEVEYPFSKLLYGSGNVEFIGIKTTT